ncbi:helix-hairpin-helix domain-containing protein [Leifsonia sp. NPDC080035]|uniref:Helix-hairpin-helix domain-containing protein n=1 Tax=Leifsonia sp. NPDC080035 TaxID=3143936 RepID=A0AAU7GCC7_9MICO
MRHRDDEQDQRPRHRLRVTVGAAVVLLVAAFAIAVVSSALGSGGSAPVASYAAASRAPTPSAAASASPGAVTLFVHVAGAVRTPGLVELRPGARVVDAVTAAGGFAEDADHDGVNLARPVQDGEQLRVPRVGEAVTAAPGDGSSPAGSPPARGLVDLNAATQEQLEDLPRIGPALAQRILEWREANGRFAAVEDLMQVSGIGQKVFDGLKDRVRV